MSEFLYQEYMKDKIKSFVKQRPLLEKYTRILMDGNKIMKTKSKRTIRGKRNNIKINKSAILYSCTFDIVGNNNEIEINASTILNNVNFYIRGDSNKINIGERVKFIRGGTLWIEDYECEASIGKQTTFEDVHIAVTEPKSKITIGEDCMFAYDIDLRTGDSHSIIDSETNERINFAQNIVIGNHVWIASHVSILKGVCLLDNTIVATRSVVTNSFDENNIIIGGVPAKKIKENINWDRRRIQKISQSQSNIENQF